MIRKALEVTDLTNCDKYLRRLKGGHQSNSWPPVPIDSEAILTKAYSGGSVIQSQSDRLYCRPNQWIAFS